MEPGAVLDFWFREHGAESWFAKASSFDAAIRDRFGVVHALACQGGLDHWADDPYGRLALILVLDQFSRNLYRGDARAFAADPAALALARRTVDEGMDRSFGPQERMFVYLPFEHSESKADQERSVALFAALGNPDLLDWAQRHKAIIDRFGRFPHRNAALGRPSTPDEQAFLEQPGSSF